MAGMWNSPLPQCVLFCVVCESDLHLHLHIVPFSPPLIFCWRSDRPLNFNCCACCLPAHHQIIRLLAVSVDSSCRPAASYHVLPRCAGSVAAAAAAAAAGSASPGDVFAAFARVAFGALMRALCAAHDAGVVHNDVKPDVRVRAPMP